VALTFSGDALREDCVNADLVVSLVPIRRGCRDAVTVDRFELWRGGTHAIRIEPDGALHIETVAATLGDRPWVLDRMREALRRGRLIGEPHPAEEADDAASETSSDED
jgi:competence protein ComEC